MEFIKNDGLPFPDYPRPQFKRQSYFNLNGKWQYAITKSSQVQTEFDGEILVPYSPEARLSGVQRQVKADDFLHCKRSFKLPAGFNVGRVLLNVGACDQITDVFVNGKQVCHHEGGYNAFTADITDALTDGENELYFLITDDASTDVYGRGKQMYKRGGIWYTATSGIWQSVWLESVPQNYISSVRLTPSFKSKTLEISRYCVGEGDFYACIKDGEALIAEGKTSGKTLVLNADSCLPWSPESPKLYTVIMRYGEDVVEGYFGMREFSTKVIDGKRVFTLNGKPCYHSGLLDQGYWEDGLYTPPSNEAMYNELKLVKEAGFNMLRKHIKVEPMLWYYYCDVLGILVWQDMLNGGGKYPQYRLVLAPFINLRLNDTNYKKMKRSEASRKQYMIEAKEMMAQLYNCVSLCLWTPFNECWGQFDAVKVLEALKKEDSTRLYDHASGWQDKGAGDLNSRHIYAFWSLRAPNHVQSLAVIHLG